MFGGPCPGIATAVKVFFIPISVTGSLLAGALGRWLFGQVWELFDDQEPPQSEHLRASWAKVVVSAVVRGAIFAGVRAAVDRGTRMAFMNVTGAWPGEEEPDPA